jgi:hypothetical protein
MTILLIFFSNGMTTWFVEDVFFVNFVFCGSLIWLQKLGNRNVMDELAYLLNILQNIVIFQLSLTVVI